MKCIFALVLACFLFSGCTPSLETTNTPKVDYFAQYVARWENSELTKEQEFEGSRSCYNYAQSIYRSVLAQGLASIPNPIYNPPVTYNQFQQQPQQGTYKNYLFESAISSTTNAFSYNAQAIEAASYARATANAARLDAVSTCLMNAGYSLSN